jgi:hypothetical protein
MRISYPGQMQPSYLNPDLEQVHHIIEPRGNRHGFCYDMRRCRQNTKPRKTRLALRLGRDIAVDGAP